MPELELTWGRSTRITWAFLWRLIGFTFLFGGAVGGVLAVVIALSGHPEWGQSRWVYNWIDIAWFPALFMALRTALRARYKEFRIILISQHDDEPGG